MKMSHNHLKLNVAHAYGIEWNDWNACWLNCMRNLQEEELFLAKLFGHNFENIIT